MAETKPGISLDEDGLCQACIHHERRTEADYAARWDELEQLADEHRSDDGSYDCIIPVSGGKDSTFQTYVLTEKLDMNPLLVAVGDPFTKTEAGRHNLQNLCDTFDCDLVTMEVSPSTARTMMRTAFEELGSPTWPIDRSIYCVPIQIGMKFDIPLIVYGENVSWEYGGVLDAHEDEEDYSAKDQIHNDVAKEVEFDLWLENGVSEDDLNMMLYPTEEEVESAGLEPVYLSYFIPWDGVRNYRVAQRHGFRTLKNEWNRDGYLEHYDQIDSVGYLINVWMKYPKFGFARATDVVGYWRRSDRVDLSLEEAADLIVRHDHRLDERILSDFLDFTGLSAREFWEVAESHRNEKLFSEPFDGMEGLPRPIRDFENLDLPEAERTPPPTSEL